MGFVAPVVAALGTAKGIAAAATVVGTVAQIKGTRDAAKAQDRAAEQQRQAYQAEQRRAEVQNVRNVRQQIRAARMAQGAMVNTAGVTGGLQSTGVAGGTSSVGSQLAGNLSFMSQIAQQNTAISNAQISAAGFQSQAARAQATGQLWGQIGSIGGTIFEGMTGQSVGQAVGKSTYAPGFYRYGGRNIDVGNQS
jgi:hypothetical protein